MHQTIHPRKTIRNKVPPRFASWVTPEAREALKVLQKHNPTLDIIGSFARVSDEDLAAITLLALGDALDCLVSTTASEPPEDPLLPT